MLFWFPFIMCRDMKLANHLLLHGNAFVLVLTYITSKKWLQSCSIQTLFGCYSPNKIFPLLHYWKSLTWCCMFDICSKILGHGMEYLLGAMLLKFKLDGILCWCFHPKPMLASVPFLMAVDFLRVLELFCSWLWFHPTLPSVLFVKKIIKQWCGTTGVGFCVKSVYESQPC